jgi:DHA3 family macrolide efflux protein-like MFS transporter
VFSLLKNRGVLFLSLSNTVSQLGDRLTHMVIVTLIGVVSPGRVSAFSEFAVAFSLPVMLLSPFVGVLVDHWNKQTIMFRCHIIQTVLIILTPTVVGLTHSVVPIWVLVILFFSLDVFNNTSRNTVIPDLVPFDDLVPANSIIVTLTRVATFLGMVGGGYLIKWVGWQLGFYIDASTHCIAGCLALGMGARILFEPVKKIDFSLGRELKKSLKLFANDLRELLILLARDRVVVFVMISVFILPLVASTAYTILIFMVQQQFGLGTAGVGLFGGVIGIGMLAGAVAMGIFGRLVSRGVILIVSMAALTIFFLLGPFFVTPVFLYIMAFIAGVVFSLIGIAQDTMLQEDVLKGIRGRIFGTKEFIINLTFTVCAVIIGIVSSRLAPYTILFIVGFVLLLATGFSLVIFRQIPSEIRAKL